MWISNFSISKPVITIVVMLALVVFGGISLLTLDTDEFPEVSPPVLTVAVPYPGAAPEGVERELVVPLEESFSSISGIDKLSSTSYDSFALIILQFDFSKNLQEASQDIRDKISAIRQDLPPEMKEPIITRFDPADLPILSLTLSSPKSTVSELTRIADPKLTGLFRAVPGVADVEIAGDVERELTVELHPEALQAAGVGVGQVVAALQSQNLAAPVGRITTEKDERSIRLRGRLETPDEFSQLVVTHNEQRLVRLGDIATVRDGEEDTRSMAFHDRDRAVGLNIKKAKGYSTTAVSEKIRARVDEIQKTLPADVKLRIVQDAGVRVEQSVDDVKSSLFEGAILTVIVVFLFLNSWRSTVITGLALPVSVLASFIAVQAFGFTLNTMSLLGLSLAIGILIDDAIVVRENIVRHVEMGKDHVTASREGTAEIGLAVAATTFSIVVVFLPIAFMGGEAQQWFAPFALTIACSVMVSLFVSFSLDPMLSAMWPDPHVEEHKRNRFTRLIARFNTWFDSLTGGYKRIIRWSLDHRWVVGLLAVVSFVVALALPATGLVGSAFFPVTDNSEFYVVYETPPGSSLEYTRKKAEELAALAREWPEVAYTYINVGGQAGSGTVDEGNIYMRLNPRAERLKSQDVLADEIRGRLQRVAGVTAYVNTGFMGQEKQVQVQLTGPDVNVLTRLAEQAAELVRKVPGAADVGLSTRGQKPELDVTVHRDLAATLGMDVGQIAQALRPAFEGIDAGDWVDPDGETRDVMVRFTATSRSSVGDLESVPLVLQGAAAAPAVVPLGQVAEVKLGLGPAQIGHLNRERVVTVGANAQGRPLSEVVNGVDEAVKGLNFPAGYGVRQGGEAESQAEVFQRMLVALGVAVLLMYMILVMQFGSFLDPIAIMASLPLSLIGVMLALLVTNSTLNMMSMIGVILLMGIVAKNAILLIDFAKWSHEKGMSRHEALIEAGGVRLRPIVMTSLAVIAGMLPVAFGTGEGSEFRAPLGRAVIGGVITSTVLTLVVIPTLYDVLAQMRERLSGWLRQKGPLSHPESHGPHPGAAQHEGV